MHAASHSEDSCQIASGRVGRERIAFCCRAREERAREREREREAPVGETNSHSACQLVAALAGSASTCVTQVHNCYLRLKVSFGRRKVGNVVVSCGTFPNNLDFCFHTLTKSSNLEREVSGVDPTHIRIHK